MDLQLTDKVAIVTGSSRGLGLASARALIAEGCRVCICARGPEQLAAAAIEVEAVARRPNMIITAQADVSTAEGIAAVIDRTLERFGGLDILVNNAAINRGDNFATTTDRESCMTGCANRGHSKSQCVTACRPGLCHPGGEQPYCVSK